MQSAGLRIELLGGLLVTVGGHAIAVAARER